MALCFSRVVAEFFPLLRSGDLRKITWQIDVSDKLFHAGKDPYCIGIRVANSFDR